jgi:hypothetical protein
LLAGWVAVLAMAAISASSASLGALFPTFREIVGWMLPIGPWGQLVPLVLVVFAVALGAALGPRTEDSLVVPAILASAAIGVVATAWVFVLARGLTPLRSGPVGDDGIALEKAAIFAGAYLTIAIGSVLPLSLGWAWILRTAARRSRPAGAT